MSIGSARRHYAVVTRLPIVARRRFGGSETMRCVVQLASALVALALGIVAVVPMLDLALDHVHGWIGQ